MTDTKITPKPGETWVRRDGGLARIYAVDGGDGFAIHGARNTADGWVVDQWTVDGAYLRRISSPRDLICKYDWRIELAPIWAVLKPKYRWFAWDGGWNGLAFEHKPQKSSYGWSYGGSLVHLDGLMLPLPYCPWYETLTERPEVQD